MIADVPFGRARIGFAGFGPKQVTRFLVALDHRRGEPDLLRLADAVALPAHACLFDADGHRIPETLETHIDRGGARSPTLAAKLAILAAQTAPDRVDLPAGLPVVRGPVIFLGKLTQHFGHILADLLSRMWALDRFDPDTRLLLLPSKNPFSFPGVRAVMGMLGLGEDRFVRIDRPTRFADLICPLAAIRWSERVYSVFDRPHRTIGRRSAAEAAPATRPVYLSRRGLGPGHRVIHDEDRLEERLRREGYDVLRPETLSLAGQAAIFRGPAPVVGVMGSALHSLLFRDTGAPKRMGILTDQDIHGRFLLFDAVKGTRPCYLNCLDSGDTMPTRIQERTLSVDVDRAMAMLDAAGLLGRRAGRSGAPPRPAAPTLNVRVEPSPGGKVVAYDKDNGFYADRIPPGTEGRVVLATPSGARWLALVDERRADRTRLYALRRLSGPDHGQGPVPPGPDGKDALPASPPGR